METLGQKLQEATIPDGMCWKEIGAYGGVVKIKGKWVRVDCASCAFTKGIATDRWQGPPTAAMEKAFKGPITMKIHDPKGKH